MFKCISYYFACLLVVLMPLQALAAANMLVCKDMMRTSITQANTQKIENAPCHKHMASMTVDSKNQHITNVEISGAEKYNKDTPCKTSCKAVCATLCASLVTMAAQPNDITAVIFLVSSTLISMPNQVYASITQASLQRPPIFLA